jgi:hypothetical protein
VLGERSGVLEAPALGVAAGVFVPAMLPLSNEALIPLVGVHRELTQEEELTHTHTRRKNSGHRGFCVAYSLQPFLIISLAIYSITEEWQVEILPMRHDPNYLLAPSHEHRNDSGHKLAHDPL